MKPNVIIRMGAAHWDVRVKAADGSYATFNLRRMDKNQRRNFHREFMNAYRQSRRTAP